MILFSGVLTGILFMLYAFGVVVGLMIGGGVVISLMVLIGFVVEWIDSVVPQASEEPR